MSVWLLGETIRWRRTLGIALAFAGIVIISFDPRVFAYWEGLALVVCSSFVGSLGLIFVKRLKGIRPLELQAWIAARRRPDAAAAEPDARSRVRWESVRNANWEGWSALFFTTVMSSLIAHTAGITS